MLKTTFDLYRRYRVIIYLRMSSKHQNPRSPDQQLDVIKELIRQLELPWDIVAIYRDDGISGRYNRKRPNYQRMIRDLKTRKVQADLILVDTFERLTRADDGDKIRRDFMRMGLLVLTADTRFADPTTMVGQAMTMLESFRSREDGRIKAHNVLRGKKDAVYLKHWAGGVPPLGIRLKTVFKSINGFEEIDYRVAEPDPHTRWIVEEIYRLADELGYGPVRIANALNNDPRIPDDLKPFHPATIGNILDNAMYIGEYIWGRNCTGIVDDKRVVQPLPQDEWQHIVDYCDPIVDRARWDRVQKHRESRRAIHLARAKSRPSTVSPIAPGLALKYPLSGLVYCSHCKRRMTAQASSPYTTASGEEKRYVNYGCCGTPGGLCHNRKRVPETWLRETVVALMRQRLHLDDCHAEHPAMLEFIEIVRRELESLDTTQPDPSAAIDQEKRELEELCRGWLQSLGKPNLMPTIRSSLEAEFERANARIRQIDADQGSRLAGQEQRQRVLDPREIAQSLRQLATILAGDNASAMNLMLSQHIDSIWCDDAGHVTVRSCKLGALAGNLDLFPRGETSVSIPSPSVTPARYAATPRRRACLDTGGAIDDDEMVAEANEFAVNTDRFAGLGPEWFTEDQFEVPVITCWAETHAIAVAEYRLSTNASMDVTAAHFGKTTPTIRSALQHAVEKHGIDAIGRSVSRPTLRNWSRANAQVVADFMKRPGVTMKIAAAHFERSEPTIRKAILFAQSQASEPDTNSPRDVDQDGQHDAA